MEPKTKEIYDLIKPFFTNIKILRNDKKYLELKLFREDSRFIDNPINVIVYLKSKELTIYTFGSSIHNYLAPEYYNMFNFYYDLLSFAKLINGMGEERHYKY